MAQDPLQFTQPSSTFPWGATRYHLYLENFFCSLPLFKNVVEDVFSEVRREPVLSMARGWVPWDTGPFAP